MDIIDVVILDDAVDDMEEGKAFYEIQKASLGDYFWDCILSDIESLIIYAGVHQVHFGFYRLLSKRFPYAIYYEVNDNTAYVMAILPVRADPAVIAEKMQRRH